MNFRLGVGSEGEAAVHRDETLRESLSVLPLIIRAPEQPESTGTWSGENREQAICQPDMVYSMLLCIFSYVLGNTIERRLVKEVHSSNNNQRLFCYLRIN